MAHGREEVALGPARGVGGISGRDQGLLDAAAFADIAPDDRDGVGGFARSPVREHDYGYRLVYPVGREVDVVAPDARADRLRDRGVEEDVAGVGKSGQGLFDRRRTAVGGHVGDRAEGCVGVGDPSVHGEGADDVGCGVEDLSQPRQAGLALTQRLHGRVALADVADIHHEHRLAVFVEGSSGQEFERVGDPVRPAERDLEWLARGVERAGHRIHQPVVDEIRAADLFGRLADEESRRIAQDSLGARRYVADHAAAIEEEDHVRAVFQQSDEPIPALSSPYRRHCAVAGSHDEPLPDGQHHGDGHGAECDRPVIGVQVADADQE